MKSRVSDGQGIREHVEEQQAAADEAERLAVLKGISYVMRQRQPFGCTVRLGLAERFLNWYPRNTKLYIRGQRGKGWDEQRRLDAELALALGPFLRQLVDEEVGVRLAEQHRDCEAERVRALERLAIELFRQLEDLDAYAMREDRARLVELGLLIEVEEGKG
jgi:hypothetical protein